MAISGLTPVTALPTSMAANPSAMLPTSQLVGSPLLGASAGVQEQPGILSRLMSAMRAAVSELRGGSGSSTLALQAPVAHAPVTIARPAAGSGSPTKAKFPNAKTWIDKQGNIRQVGAGKVLTSRTGTASVAAPVTGSNATAQLPSNAVQVPGAMVYSYDQNGNPVTPTMSQLGVSPTMMQGFTGLADSADESQVPQVNATNQNTIGANGTLGATATPVLGQPILVTGATTSTAATRPATQAVTNENVNDVDSRNQGLGYGYGYGYGSGVATPYAPYGSSMTGSYSIGDTLRRWF